MMSVHTACHWETFRDWAERRTGWRIPQTASRTRPASGIVPIILDGKVDPAGPGHPYDYDETIRRRFLAIVRWRRHAWVGQDAPSRFDGQTPDDLLPIIDAHPEGGWYLRVDAYGHSVGSDAEAEAFIRAMMNTPYAFAAIAIPDTDDAALDVG